MPTTSMASAVSRQTMKSALPMNPCPGLLRDDPALPGLLVELVEELVLAGLQCVDRYRRLPARRDDLLLLQVPALEFDRRLALVGDVDAKPLAGRNLDHGRLEHAVARDDLERGHFLRYRIECKERAGIQHDQRIEGEASFHAIPQIRRVQMGALS